MKSTEKILSREGIIKKAKAWRDENKKIVFTNGCFDIIHVGHIDYLEKARQFGDVLIVGMNSDNSISRIKGPKRPVIVEESRSRVMAALMFVDAVTIYDEETPYELIKSISPNVLVKGDDWSIENIVGADFVIAEGGEVCTISLVEGFSTSNIIKKILEVY